MKFWEKLSHKEQDDRITEALSENLSFDHNISLGIPVSKLDQHVFYEHAGFLKDAPLLRTYVQNPNHIGCHTTGISEPFYAGTQKLEREVIELLSTDVFFAEDNSCDGYIASGGTEANIQAVWMFRNYFIGNFGALHKEIALLSSADTHYSVSKASNLLNIVSYTVPVDGTTRTIIPASLHSIVEQAMQAGIKYFIVIANMGTTMFGSVDDPDLYVNALLKYDVEFKIHADGAFGGFIYPFSNNSSNINFNNPNISSIALDAHKMLQAPYGTGIFIARKGLIQYVCTREASYVNGMDLTLSGSRSGTNAIAVWMILFTYGPYGWLEKINKLLYRTKWLCKMLNEKNIEFYRHTNMNIVTIRAKHISRALALKYGLVPDKHEHEPEWYKVVVMDHVEIAHLMAFVEEL